MKQDDSTSQGVILPLTQQWRSNAFRSLKGLLGTSHAFVYTKRCSHAPVTMQIVWHLKAIAAALLVLDWRRGLRALQDPTLQHYAPLMVVAIALPVACLLLRKESYRQQPEKDPSPGLPHSQQLSPRIFECRTDHTRLLPKKHSFSYSYLLVGVPIGWRGAVGSIISSDISISSDPATPSETWFSVHAEDYLERGGHIDGLAGKLRDYLTTQNASMDDYPYAYLVTAPRFLGFSFNPVSFWYLYDKTKELAAMILEVNNTFDERRMYFLPRQALGDARASRRFAQHWDKDFHVSPFNDREGSYSLSAVDPLETTAQIDNNLVLSSNDGKPKIIARVYSTKPGLIPASMSALSTISFLARWWWVGFMTNPRIIREARVLWVKGLQVFYRPEVMATSIGRTPSAEENSIEVVFYSWLQDLSDFSDTPINYTAAANDRKAMSIYPGNGNSARRAMAKQEVLEIKILTPAFYAEMARDPDLRRVFERVCYKAGKGEAMMQISNAEQLNEILKSFGRRTLQPSTINLSSSIIQLLRSGRCGMLVAWLQGKCGISSVSPSGVSPGKQSAILDKGLKSTADSSQQVLDYEQACLKILFADRFAFGLTSLLKFYVRLAWLVAFTSTVFHLHQWIHKSRGYESQDIFSFGMKALMMLVVG